MRTNTDSFGSRCWDRYWTKWWWTIQGYSPYEITNRPPDVDPGQGKKMGENAETASYFWEEWRKS